MITIPDSIKTLLKSKVMVGDNRPTAKITVSNTLFINNRIIATSTATTQGESSNTDAYASNYVLTKDNREMSALIDETTKEILIGYISSTHEKYLSANFPVESITHTGIFVSTPAPLVLYKRTDGKVLLFIADNGVSGSVAAKVDCYISNTGNGDDFVLLSNVYTSPMSLSRFFGQVKVVHNG